MLGLNFIALDLETTGLDENAEIIEIGMVKVKNGVIIDKFERLIKPKKNIPEEITILTGITNDMVKNKPVWKEIENDVINFIDNNILLAHNVSFDKRFLEKSLNSSLNFIWLDSCEIAKIALPRLASYKLNYLSSFLKISNIQFHRAVFDAEAAAQVLLNSIRYLSNISPFTMEKILKVTYDDNGLNNFFSFLQKNIVKGYFNNNLNKESITEKENKYSETLNYKLESINNFFKPGGLLELSKENFQYRAEQVKMLETIVEAFSIENHAVIEAGTGTGKSFAYLVPALLWSQEEECRVTISTNTITLQEQLFYKDIPFLEQCFSYKFSVALKKGRSNYICLKRFWQMLKNPNKLRRNEKVFLAQIIHWLDNTIQGDKEELNLNSIDNELWNLISSKRELCMGSCCSFFSKCFYYKNRRKAEKSRIIITNHALLLQDLKSENSVLPKYEYLIIDEAHNLEDEAEKQFSEKIETSQIKKLAYQLSKRHKTGFFNRLSKIVKEIHIEDFSLKLEEIEDILKIIENIVSQIENNIYSKIDIFSLGELRITANERNTDWWKNICSLLEELANNLAAIENKLKGLAYKIELCEGLEETNLELAYFQSVIKRTREINNCFLKEEKEENVYWLQIEGLSKNKNIAFMITPLNTGEYLKKSLFDSKKSVVLTSATLAVNSNLQYTAQSLGLDDNYNSLILDSPFNYLQQSLIAIPDTLPEPSFSTNEEYLNLLEDCIKEICLCLKGGVLILFTSYNMLNYVYRKLKADLSLKEKNILAHGKDGSRTNIIENLKNNKNCVVLGTDSFWEGIDIAGDNLGAVIVIRLPFLPPNRPVIEAKSEMFEKKGESSFYKFSLPKAVLKFRQGYGRLIRTKKDKGIFIILDKRIQTKQYGKFFIKSLPKQKIIKGSIKNICYFMKDWINK